MTHADQLRALRKLRFPNDIRSYADWCDIGAWCDKVGPHFDTTLLCAKSLERIDAIFRAHFEVTP